MMCVFAPTLTPAFAVLQWCMLPPAFAQTGELRLDVPVPVFAVGWLRGLARWELGSEGDP